MQFLRNIRTGIKASIEVLKAGFSPFCPFLDYQFLLCADNPLDITVADFYRYSMAWLMAADAMLLLKGWETSLGTVEEVKVADEQNIPICNSVEDIIWINEGR